MSAQILEQKINYEKRSHKLQTYFSQFLSTSDLHSVLPLLPKSLLPKAFFAQATIAPANIAQVGFCPSDHIAQVVSLPK